MRIKTEAQKPIKFFALYQTTGRNKMSKTLKHFLGREWAMGNGQCPECYGVPKTWHGHPLYLKAEDVGHKKDCSLAELIKENGGKPLYTGDFKSDIEYCTVISECGDFGTEVKKDKISEPRQRMIDSYKEAMRIFFGEDK